MRMPEHSFVQRKCAECEEEEELQRKPLTSFITPFIQAKGIGGGIASDRISQKIDSTKDGGSNMDSGTKSFMESRFGTDFSGVKIHTDENAVQMSQELNAQAFTTGSDVYFNAGKYDPSSETGKHLLAHELTHTIQQSNNIQTKLIKKAVETDEPAKEPGVDACSEWDRDPESLSISAARHFFKEELGQDIMVQKVNCELFSDDQILCDLTLTDGTSVRVIFNPKLNLIRVQAKDASGKSKSCKYQYTSDFNRNITFTKISCG